MSSILASGRVVQKGIGSALRLSRRVEHELATLARLVHHPWGMYVFNSTPRNGTRQWRGYHRAADAITHSDLFGDAPNIAARVQAGPIRARCWYPIIGIG